METDELEFHGTEVSAAILHIVNGTGRTVSLSETCLDLDNEELDRYITGNLKKMQRDNGAAPGTFLDSSRFEELLGSLFRREMSFVTFSQKALEPFITYLNEEESGAFDILFADYREDDVPYIGFFLLEHKPGMMHRTELSESGLLNTLSFAETVLPSPGRKPVSFAFVNQLSHEIFFYDGWKWEKRKSAVAEVLLECQKGMSKKEAVKAVEEAAKEVAESFHEDPAAVLSRLKTYISQTAEEELPLTTQEAAETVFPDAEMRQAFQKAAMEREVPEEVYIPERMLSRTMKNQKIRTDNGIEIVVPAAFFNDRNFIEVDKNEDGSYSIAIKNVRFVK